MRIRHVPPHTHELCFEVSPDESVWRVEPQHESALAGHMCWAPRGDELWVRLVACDEPSALRALDYARHWARAQGTLRAVIEQLECPDCWPHSPMGWAQQVTWGALEHPGLRARLERGARPWRALGARALLMREDF